jgi:spermidine/putrescine transport system substrate-binding protein
LALLIALAACNGGGDEETATNTNESSSGETAATEPAEEPEESEPTEESAAEEMSLPDEPILILEWSGYEVTVVPTMYLPFTEVYSGVLDSVVEYSIFADDAEALTKVQTGVGADVVHPCNSWWGLYVESGLVQPIDTSRLSNWSGIHPDLAALGQFNGEQYFVPWEWGYESILVRTDLVENVPTSWADVWNEEYAGHVSQWDSAESNYSLAALSLGLDPFNTTPEEDEQIKQALLDLKPNLLTYWSDYTESYDLPQGGDVWVLTSAWQDAYAYVLGEGFEVEYVQPAEKRLGWVCGYGIMADAKNVDLIYEFLDAAISPESMASLANTYWYGMANFDALPLIDEYVVEFMQLNEPDSLFDRAFFYQTLTEEKRQTMVRIWDEVKAAP